MTVTASSFRKTALGLRERLLLSFAAIGLLAVIAAAFGNYAFYALGEALWQITERSIPPALASLELARRTERVVAGGPALLSATTDAEFRTTSTAVDQELASAGALLRCPRLRLGNRISL